MKIVFMPYTINILSHIIFSLFVVPAPGMGVSMKIFVTIRIFSSFVARGPGMGVGSALREAYAMKP
jgi:hypothetical protein